jgi:hypothetical protein
MRSDRLLLVTILAAALAGCGKAQARTPAPMPDLNPPSSPSKLVIPVAVTEPTPVEPPVSTPETTPPPPETRPARSGGRGTPPPPTETPPPVQDPQVLRTNANIQELENQTRLQLGSAARDLSRVSRSTLGAEARASYDDVQRFIRSAEAALKVKNYVLARQLADKAALLASLLVKGGVPTAA